MSVTIDIRSHGDIINAHLDRLGLNSHTLDEDAHLPLEILCKLDSAVLVGNPEDWMQNNLNRVTFLRAYMVPKVLQDFINSVEATFNPFEEIKVMTELANSGSPADASARKMYQIAERKLMQMTISRLEENIKKYPSENTIQYLALRGAKFFENTFSRFAGMGKIEVETKRMKLNGGQYAVGFGKTQLMVSSTQGIEQVILPDDCISTGMSQVGSINRIFELGLRPKQIVIPVTVATSDGVFKILNEANLVRAKYNAKFDLYVGASVMCHAVDKNMYLSTLDGKQLVGDMGAWNEEVDQEF